MLQPPAAVIFDMDGCLVDSEPLSIGAIAQEMQRLGIDDVSFEYIRDRFLGVSMHVIWETVASRMGRVSQEEFVERVESRLIKVYSEKLRKIEGVPNVLAALEQEGVATAVATGASIRRMNETLAAGGLTSWFRGVAFSADQVAHGKPAPDIFFLAAKELGVSPEACVVVEDSPHGVEGAVAARMRAVGFVGGSHLEGVRAKHGKLLEKKGAETVATNMAGVIQAILSPGARVDA